MASILSTITEIIWPSLPTAGGMNIGMRLCRTDPSFPGAGQYDAGAANKIYLNRTLSPRLASDYELHQAFQATNGKSMLDNLNLQFIDVERYAGTLNGSPITEDFTGQSTFFTEFFNDTAGFNTKNWPVALYIDIFDGSGNYIETSFLFHVDPNYKPQQQLITFSMDGRSSLYARPELLHEGTVRTLQGVALGNLLSGIQFQATLNYLGSFFGSNMIQGAGYMGFVAAPDSAVVPYGYSYPGIFSGSSGRATNNGYMEATIYENSQIGHGGTSYLYNEVAPSSRGGSFIPTGHLMFDQNHVGTTGTYTDNWWGPCGTWWISLGTLIDGICNSIGQIYASDGVIGPNTGFPYTSSTLNSPSAQFTASMIGSPVNISLPDNGGEGFFYILSVTSPTAAVLSSDGINPHIFTVTGIGGPLSWFIIGPSLGPSPQALLFDVNAQMGSASPLALQGLQRYKQKPDNTNFCYPVDTTAPVLPKDIYISVNAFFGSHPFDGSQWLNPIAWTPMTAVQDVLQGICNFLGCEYNIIIDPTTKRGRLVLDPVGVTGGAIPKSWIPIGNKFQEVEPSTGSTAVTVQNVGDNQQIMCPFGPASNSTTAFPVPIRLRTWGSCLPQVKSDSFVWDFAIPFTTVNFGTAVTQFIGGIIFDGADSIFGANLTNGMAEDCFRSVFTGAGGDNTLNANCWKGLCFAMFADTSATNIMYPTGWTPLGNGGGSVPWSGKTGLTTAFYALGSQYGIQSGTVINGPTASEPNYQRFNSIDYQAVIYATYLIQTLSILLQRDFYGTTDDGTNGGDGKLSTVDIGMTGTFQYDGKERTFMVVELPRFLLMDYVGGLKLQEVPGEGFPDITSLIYGPVPGSAGAGGTSSTGQSTGGGTGGGSSLSPTIANVTISSNVDNYVLPTIGTGAIYFITLAGTDPQTWRMSGIAGGTNGMRITLTNTSTGILTLSNMDVLSAPQNQFFTVPGTECKIMPGMTQDLLWNGEMSKWTLPGFNGFNS